MKRTHTRAIVTDLILEILAETPDLTCAKLLRAVQLLRPCSRAHVRRVLDELEENGAITCNRSALRPFPYRIKEDDGLPVVVRGEETPKFDGPVLSPIAWSMRHLLGAP